MKNNQKQKSKNTRELLRNVYLRLFLIIAGSVLFSLSNPNIIFSKGCSYFAWILFLPFLLLIKKSSVKDVWFFSGVYGLISILFYAYWLYNYDSLCLFLALGIYFIYFAIFGLILKFIEFKFKKHYWFIQFLAICTFDYLRTLGFLGFHYGVSAYTQWNNDLIIQIVDVIGVFGLNLLVIFPSCAIYSVFVKLKERKIILNKIISDDNLYECKTHINYVSENEKKLKEIKLTFPVISFCVWGVLLIAVLIYGYKKLNRENNYKSITVAAIQHNDDPNSNGINNFKESTQNLINLTDEAMELNPGIDLVVWPETAVVPSLVYYYEKEDSVERNKLVNYILNYFNNRNAYFIIGNEHIEVKKDGNKFYYNSALMFHNDENVIPPEPQIYSKIHLVPFSESFPYEKYFPSIYKTILERQKFFWTPGKEINIFKINDFNFFTPICFEDTFPDICRQAYQKGARCFVSLANDSWSKSEACQYQHLAMAKMRAVENRVPVIISSVSGQTSIITKNGEISAMAIPFTQTYVIGEVEILPQSQKPTIYNQIGDIFGYGIAFLLLALLIIKVFIDIIKLIRKQ